MSLGLTNLPSAFTRLMNCDLCAFIVKFIIVYFDDIVICIQGLDEWMGHQRQVIDVLRKESLYADANLVITWSCNPQPRMRSNLGKPK